MIGETIKGQTGEYKITELVAGPDRPNANVYLCSGPNAEIFVAKHFYNQSPMANIGLNVYNHYGRRRDGSELVFSEIQQKNGQFPFLVKYIDRINHNGKWIVIQEYVAGATLVEFMYDNSEERALQAIEAFALALTEWHNNQFAHGDPHLENVIVMEDSLSGSISIKLIDYCQIHHPSFHYCGVYECFSPEFDKRFKGDLHETSGKLGRGFRQEIIEIDHDLSFNGTLVDKFDAFYAPPVKD